MGCLLKTIQRMSRSKFAGTSGHVFQKKDWISCIKRDVQSPLCRISAFNSLHINVYTTYTLIYLHKYDI